MTTELVYRMRTCAAALVEMEGNITVRIDAAMLLNQAADLLEVPEPLGEPMEMITSVGNIDHKPSAIWGGELPANPIAKPCPVCGSIDARTVRRTRRHLMLTCPVCNHQWEYSCGPTQVDAR
jgi:hypothetical protein